MDGENLMTESGATTTEQPQSRRVTKTGRVVSDKNEKTAVVMVDHYWRHPIYGKTTKRSKKFHAHDAENECKEGDVVLIEESRPFSKKKRWVVREIIQRAADR